MTVLVLMFGLLLGGTARAVSTETAPTPLTKAQVRQFLDAHVPALLREHAVPGASVAVVGGGQRLVGAGYGYADLASKRPVDPARTAFPTASIAKSFTAIAVLQLVEQGRLRLHTDVNRYLPPNLRVPDRYPGRPITLHHLLTHTAGFGETFRGPVASRDAAAPPGREYDHQPERIYPPGEITAYSNYGLTLTGLIVERVSGSQLENYLERAVFAPLGMHHTGSDIVSAKRGFTMPTAYVLRDGRNVPSAELREAANGAGGVFSTAEDMSRFMLALLGDGVRADDGPQVLGAVSQHTMLSRQAGNDPRLPGLGYGTEEIASDGPRAVGHGGDTTGIHTRYALFPNARAGIYVSINGDGKPTDGGNDLRADLLDAFEAEFLPNVRQTETTSLHNGLERFEGTYVTSRTTRAEPAALGALVQYASVGVDGGSLRISGASLGEQSWFQVAPRLFRSADGERQLAFLVRDGEVFGLAADSPAALAFLRVPWYESPQLHLGILVGAALLLASVLAWPLTSVVRRIRGRAAAPHAAARFAQVLAFSTALGLLGYLAFLIASMAHQDTIRAMLITDSAALSAPLTVAVPLVLGVLACAVLGWTRRWFSRVGRAHFTVVALAATTVLLVGYRYGLMWTPA